MQLHRLLLLPLIVASCGRAEPDRTPAAATVDSAGIAIVTSPGEDRALAWRLERLFQVEESESAKVMLSKVNKASVAGGAGVFYVLTDDGILAQYDSTGRLNRTIGRQGAGPGELQLPGSLFATTGRHVGVFDYGKQAIVEFDADGRALPETRYEALGQPWGTAHRRGDSLLVPTVDFSRTGPMSIRLRLATPTDTLTLAAAERPGSAEMVDFKCVGLSGLPPMFTPEFLSAWDDSTIALSRRAEYEIEIYRRGKLARLVRRSVTPPPATAELYARYQPDGQTITFGGGGRAPCKISPQDLAAKLGIARLVPSIAALHVSPDDFLWVTRLTYADETPRLDVFNPEGAYLGTLSATGQLVAFTTVGQVLFAEPDTASGGNRLVGYHVVKPD